MSTWDTQHRPRCHAPSCNLVSPDVWLVVVSGRRVVRADHVASAQRGHLVHSGAVLAASPREAHLSVLWLRSLCECYSFTSLLNMCAFKVQMCVFVWLVYKIMENCEKLLVLSNQQSKTKEIPFTNLKINKLLHLRSQTRIFGIFDKKQNKNN